MPILDIEVVARKGEVLPEALARDLADDLGRAFEASPGKIWVRLRTLPDANYAENDVTADRPFPVFVSLTASAPPEGAALETHIKQITELVAKRTNRPAANVHVLVEPAAKGRIAFGGRLAK